MKETAHTYVKLLTFLSVLLFTYGCATNDLDAQLRAEEEAWERNRLIIELLRDPVIIKALENKQLEEQ